MRHIKHAAVLIAIAWTFATPAVGQDDCLASFAVNPSKSVTYLPIGPNAGDRIDTMMSCSVAERMRNEFFLTGKTIDRNLLGNAGQLMSKILEIKMRLASHKAELERATTKFSHFDAVQNLRDAVLAAGLASATTGCIVSAEACKPAVRASFELYELASSPSKDLAQARGQAQKDISTLDSMLQSIQVHLSDNVARQSTLRFDVVISEMCRAIKQQCK